jgi:hypothetical protein
MIVRDGVNGKNAEVLSVNPHYLGAERFGTAIGTGRIDGKLLCLRHSRWLAENFPAASVKQLANPGQIPQDFQQSQRRHGREFARGFGDLEA